MSAYKVSSCLLALSLVICEAAYSEENPPKDFDRKVCNAEIDLNAKRDCLIRLDGYSSKTCSIFRSSKSISLCKLDLSIYQSLEDECRKDLDCYWKDKLQPIVDAYVRQIIAMKHNDFTDRSFMGRLLNISDDPRIDVLHWKDPGKGSVVFQLDNQGGWFVTPKGEMGPYKPMRY